MYNVVKRYPHSPSPAPSTEEKTSKHQRNPKKFPLEKKYFILNFTLVDELSLDGFPPDPTNICLDPTKRQIFVSLTSQLQT